jgi:hypothetical protein
MMPDVGGSVCVRVIQSVSPDPTLRNSTTPRYSDVIVKEDHPGMWTRTSCVVVWGTTMNTALPVGQAVPPSATGSPMVSSTGYAVLAMTTVRWDAISTVNESTVSSVIVKTGSV